MFGDRTMVKEYLEKTKEQFHEDRIILLKKKSDYQNKLKENIQMLQLLEESEDPNLEAFTPREVNHFNKEKIKELAEEQKEISRQLKIVDSELAKIDRKVDEINSVIKVSREDILPLLEGAEDDFSPKFRLALLETQENERQRIARDLHDSTVQNLTSLVHKSELCMKLMDVDVIRCRLELSALTKTLRAIIDDTRKMIYDLRPMSFDDIGFDVTVERFLDKFRVQTPLHISYEVIGEPYNINSVISLTLLRIIQEACNNAIKHANASKLSVQMKYGSDDLHLFIEDDGQGFDPHSIPDTPRQDNSGFGMSMMKERVYLLSGTIEVDSAVGKGCRISVSIPVNKEDK